MLGPSKRNDSTRRVNTEGIQAKTITSRLASLTPGILDPNEDCPEADQPSHKEFPMRGQHCFVPAIEKPDPFHQDLRTQLRKRKLRRSAARQFHSFWLKLSLPHLFCPM